MAGIEGGSSEFRMNNHTQNSTEGTDDGNCSSFQDGERQMLVGPVTTEGLTVFMTAVFLVGEMAGSGVLALPAAVEDTSWIGLVLIVFVGLISSYTNHVLGQCWIIVKERFPTMDNARYPYSGIGMLTYGVVGRLIISVAINFTLYGVSCVLLLLAAENLQSVFKDNSVFDLSFCYWLIIIAAVLLPLTMRATPKAFKFVAMGAAASSCVASVILVVLIGIDSKNNSNKPVHHDKIDPLRFAAALGTISFAFAGHLTSPSFQNDMKQPKRFGFACAVAYTAMVLLYFPVAAAGYFVYGNRLTANVLQVVSYSPALTVVQCSITLHLLCGYIIFINPLCQELEEACRVSKNFGYQRVLMRSFVGLLVLFSAEAIPDFSAILSLIGGSSITLLAYLAPPILYLKLAYSKGNWPEILISSVKVVILLVIVAIGILAGGFSTYGAIKSMASLDTIAVPSS